MQIHLVWCASAHATGRIMLCSITYQDSLGHYRKKNSKTALVFIQGKRESKLGFTTLKNKVQTIIFIQPRIPNLAQQKGTGTKLRTAVMSINLAIEIARHQYSWIDTRKNTLCALHPSFFSVFPLRLPLFIMMVGPHSDREINCWGVFWVALAFPVPRVSSASAQPSGLKIRIQENADNIVPRTAKLC